MAVYAKVAPEEKEEGEQLVTPEPSELPGVRSSLRSSLCCFTKGMCGIKAIILGSVVIQNTTYALVRRYSRGTLQETYSTSSVLLVMEIAKMLLSAVQVSPAPSTGLTNPAAAGAAADNERRISLRSAAYAAAPNA